MPKRRRTTGRRSYGSKRRKTGTRKYGSYRRRNTRKKRMGRPKTVRAPMSLADSTMVKLRYEHVYIANSAAGDYTEVVFRGNSLFDPSTGASSVQPYWYDQWAEFYHTYLVRGSSIRVQAWNQLDPPNNPLAPIVGELTVFPIAANVSFSGTAFDTVNGQAYRKQRTFQQTGGLGKGAIKHYMTTAKIFGYSPQAVTSEQSFKADIAANPNLEWFWHVGYNSMDRVNQSTVIVRVDMTFYVQFMGRQIPLPS